jgi:membrane dipeptidase
VTGPALRALAQQSAPEARSLAPVRIDALAPGSLGFDAGELVAAGLDAAAIDMAMYPRNIGNARTVLEAWNDILAAPASGMLRIDAGADLERARREGRFGVVIACQDASILGVSTYSVTDWNIENLREFHEQGLRVLQLTHNERNALGDSYREPSDAGLSLLGRAVVEEMGALGMLVDLSHCGRATTLEAIERSARPCAITHAGCRALCDTARNKTDEEIRAVAERGGFFGVFHMTNWLTRDRTATVDHVVRHIEHAIDVAGEDHVGFGSDGPPAGLPDIEAERRGMRAYCDRRLGEPGCEWMWQHVRLESLAGPDRLVRLGEAMSRRGHSEARIEKVLGGNFRRVLTEAIG